MCASVCIACCLLLQHPVTWQPSKEGDHLIGRITLSKRSAAMPKEAGAMLGLKVREGTRIVILLRYSVTVVYP